MRSNSDAKHLNSPSGTRKQNTLGGGEFRWSACNIYATHSTCALTVSKQHHNISPQYNMLQNSFSNYFDTYNAQSIIPTLCHPGNTHHLHNNFLTQK